MDAETISAIGKWILMPICVVLGLLIYFYFMTKD